MEASKFSKIENLSNKRFFRLTGVKRRTFDEMVNVLKPAHEKKREKKGGRPNRLCIEDRLLMTLEYLREYRTFFHLGQSYGLSEKCCWSNCRWVEDTLIKSKIFALPGRKTLQSNHCYELIYIDATESPICRPKKITRKGKKQKIEITDKKDFIQVRRNVIL